MELGNTSAFPNTHVPRGTDVVGWLGTSGMTLRQYFACLAMQAVISRGEEPFDSPDTCSAYACRYADSLLRALEEKP